MKQRTEEEYYLESKRLREETIRMAASIAEKIAKSSPIWLLTTHTVPDSTELLYECIKRESMIYGLQD